CRARGLALAVAPRYENLTYLSDLRRLKADYPGWDLTRSLDDILDELAAPPAGGGCAPPPTRRNRAMGVHCGRQPGDRRRAPGAVGGAPPRRVRLAARAGGAPLRP